MTEQIARKLSRAGFYIRYGSDGHDHLLLSPSRGERALCGRTASRRDYDNDKPTCDDCARRIVKEVDGKTVILSAEFFGDKGQTE